MGSPSKGELAKCCADQTSGPPRTRDAGWVNAIERIGFIHPGAMGASLGAASQVPALWASAGRSAETLRRARDAGLSDAGTVSALCEQCDAIVSICPPAVAAVVADEVASSGFTGVYVEANAIAPAVSREIAQHFDRYVDGSVIGPPAGKPGTTRLYLAGALAGDVAGCFAGGPVDARVIDGGVAAASALKMAYASWTKIGGAMLLAIRAFAEAEGVSDALVEEWAISQPGIAERSERVGPAVAPKAWRFTGEMEQIAAAFADAGQPDGFATAANEIYESLAGFKGQAPTFNEVVEALRAT